MVLIRDMGMTLGEILDLEELAERLRGRRGLRVLLLRPAAQGHRRRRLTDQPLGHQVAPSGRAPAGRLGVSAPAPVLQVAQSRDHLAGEQLDAAVGHGHVDARPDGPEVVAVERSGLV